MNFIFECSTRYLTRSLRSFVRYRVEHSKIKFISTRGHVISSIYQFRAKVKLGHLLSTQFSSSIKLNLPPARIFSTTLSFIVYDGVYWSWLGFDSQYTFAYLLISKFILISQSPCMSGPCQNSGSCVSIYEENSYLCICVKGYAGSICQTGETTTKL